MKNTKYKNELYLRALMGEPVERPPVWIMRQAGRHLPEYIALRDKYDFFTRIQTPELATEISLQPIRRYDMDAAILFSDILVVPQALGLKVTLEPGKGPLILTKVNSHADLPQTSQEEVLDKLSYVFEAIKLTNKELNKTIPLIGFGGSPWTLFCYIIQGETSKNFNLAKKFCFTRRRETHAILQKITTCSIQYLKGKIEAGVAAIQIFDSWGGLLSPEDYQEFSWSYIKQMIIALQYYSPVVVYAKGCWHALEYMCTSGAKGLGLDWTIDPKVARRLTKSSICLQGNLDPLSLHSSPVQIERITKKMINDFGKDRYIVNLGHGISPDIPIENVIAFVETVKNYR